MNLSHKSLTFTVAILACIVIGWIVYNVGYSMGFKNGYIKGEYFLTGKIESLEYGIKTKLEEIDYEITKGGHIGDKEWAKREFGNWVTEQKEKNKKYFAEFKDRDTRR